jgi:hypothetical protein
MAQPTPYQRLYDFSDFQTVNPSRPLPGSNLDAELDAVKLTTDQLRANIGLIQRDDGKLANQSVTTESLSAGALAMIHQGEYNPRGSWAASLTYALGDVIEFNAATYLCIVAHTSTPSFANDRTAGLWLLIANGALTGQSTAVDLFQGTGSQTVFTLSFTYSGNNAAVVYVSGVAQIPGQDFTISGTTLTFVSAPPAPSVAGRANVMVRGTGVEAQLAADAAGTSAANAQGFANSASSSATSAAASQTAAAASQTAAATSASNAASSATSAQTSATTATTQATSATNSATAAAASQSAAATSATNAAASASTATTQATTATTQATNAAGSATSAANSATSAAGSATTATNQAATATTQAGNAATSANNAATSATAAGNSATAAATSATGANNSAISATNSASSASTSASTATTQASSAATSATNAATSATTATTQASNAATSATNAANSATAAASSATAAAASYDEFDDRFLGAKTSNPTVDNDGNALLTGALYFNSVANEMRVWNGTAWQTVASLPDLVLESSFTATAGQTSAAFGMGGYRIGFLYVYVNGVLLSAADITATDGSNVTFASALAAGDEVRMLTFKAVGSVTTADIGALNANNPSYTGTLTGGTGVINIGSGQLYKDASGNVGIGTSSPNTGLVPGLVIGNGTDNKGITLFGTSTTQQNIAFTDTASDQQGLIQYNHGNNSMRVFTSSSERMRIDSAGNVGIGTSAPVSQLSLFKGSGENGVRFQNTATGTLSSDGAFVGLGATGGDSNGLNLFTYDATSMIFGTEGAERMRIDTSGNLLVGTTSGWFSRRVVVEGTEGLAGIVQSNTQFPISLVGLDAGGNNLFAGFYTDSRSSPLLRGTIDYNRGSNVVRYNTTSDATLKNLIGDSDKSKSCEILSSTKIREYSWKDDEAQKPQIGVIAQELHETFKGAVSVGGEQEDGTYRPWAVDKTAFTFHLIAGWQAHEKIIQEQQAIINDLKARLDAANL